MKGNLEVAAESIIESISDNVIHYIIEPTSNLLYGTPEEQRAKMLNEVGDIQIPEPPIPKSIHGSNVILTIPPYAATMPKTAPMLQPNTFKPSVVSGENMNLEDPKVLMRMHPALGTPGVDITHVPIGPYQAPYIKSTPSIHNAEASDRILLKVLNSSSEKLI